MKYFVFYLVFSSLEYEVWWRVVGDLNFLSFLYLWLIGIKFGLTQLTQRIWLIRLEIRLVWSGQLMWRFWIWFWHRQCYWIYYLVYLNGWEFLSVVAKFSRMYGCLSVWLVVHAWMWYDTWLGMRVWGMMHDWGCVFGDVRLA